MYVDSLIGPETVNTLPMETLDAYRDHGDPAPRLTENPDRARAVLRQLGELGIDLASVCQQLEIEGVEKFQKSYDGLVNSLAERPAEHLECGRTPIE
jgi:transaldolase